TTITDLAPALITPFIQAAGDLTAIWYEAQDPESDYTAIPADLPLVDALAVLARWAVLQADPNQALGGAASGEVF
ncbi:MAG: hypothetical protein ACR2JI_05120, partial [Mycobacterium sp.]